MVALFPRRTKATVTFIESRLRDTQPNNVQKQKTLDQYDQAPFDKNMKSKTPTNIGDAAACDKQKGTWRCISEKYIISESGEVFNTNTCRPLKQRKTPQGYLGLGLYFNGVQKTLTTHRLVAEFFLEDFDKSLQVDHIDGDRLNNHVSNLRMVTAQQNARGYRKPRANASSKYRGVDWVKHAKRWRAKVVSDGKEIYLGHFKDEIQAARAFDKKAIELGFEKEALNFPQS